MTAPRARLELALTGALGLWAVGVQVVELVALVGAWATAALVAVWLWQTRTPLGPWVAPFRGLLLFVAWALVVPLLAGHLPTGNGLARLSDFLLVPVAATAVAVLPARRLEQVGLAGAATLALSVGLAWLQHLGWWPGPEAFAPFAWTKLGFGRVYELAPGASDRFMAGGLLLHRLKFANVTVVASTIATGVAVRGGRWARPGWLVAALGLSGVFFCSYARAATVAGVLAVAVTWVAGARRRGAAALGGAALVLAALALGAAVPSLRARFETALTAEGSGERASLTEAGLHAVAQAPLTGIGLGRFRPGDWLPPDAPAQAREHLGKAHDQFVTLAAEAGVPAAAWLILILAGWTMVGVRTLPRGALLGGVVTAFCLLCLVHDPLFHPEGSLALMLGLGCGLGAWRRGG